MKKYYLIAGIGLVAATPAFAQIKVGATGAPDGSAMVEITSGAANDKGLLLPKLTTLQRDAMTLPANGLLIYNTTDNEVQVNTGTPIVPTWVSATSDNSAWSTAGNAGTDPATNFIGTTDNQGLAIRTNNLEQLRVTSVGDLGVGTTTPLEKLEVVDTGNVAVQVFTSTTGKMSFQLGNANHGIIRNLTGSGGGGNDVALYTSNGGGGADLFLINNPISNGSDSLPLNQFVLKSITGNVGIGTANPTEKLNVSDTGNVAIQVSATNGGSMSFQLGNQLHGIKRGLGETGGFGNDVAFYTSSDGTSADLYLASNPPFMGADSVILNQFVLKNSGNIGIGNNTPASKLHISNGGATISNGPTPITSPVINIINDGAGNQLNDDVNIYSYGDVTSPGFSVFTARGTAAAPLNAETGDNMGAYIAGTQINGDITALNIISSDYVGDGITAKSRMHFSTSGVGNVALTIDSSGYVGIGTSTPSQKLQVLGAGNVAAQVTSTTGQMSYQLGNPNHGIIRNLSTSGGGANDVALYTSNGGGGADLFLINNPIADGADSLPLTQFVLKSSGNVGIGTQDPRSKLDINGAITIGPELPPNTINATWIGWSSIREGIGETEFVNYRGTGTGGYRFYSIADAGTPGYDAAIPSPADNIGFIDAGTGAYAATSDARVKTNVNLINDGLKKVMAMHPVSYDFHTGRILKNGVVSFTENDNVVETIGFLAQELVNVVPEAVEIPKDAANELYAVSYSTLIPVLTKAIQEQQAIIDALKAELSAVKTDNTALKADISQIGSLAEKVSQLEALIGKTTTTAAK